jgi:hypothetical protein
MTLGIDSALSYLQLAQVVREHIPPVVGKFKENMLVDLVITPDFAEALRIIHSYPPELEFEVGYVRNKKAQAIIPFCQVETVFVIMKKGEAKSYVDEFPMTPEIAEACLKDDRSSCAQNGTADSSTDWQDVEDEECGK